jgi:hypothetical protein
MSTTPGGSAVARGSYPRGVSRVLRLPTRPGSAPDFPSARLECEPHEGIAGRAARNSTSPQVPGLPRILRSRRVT